MEFFSAIWENLEHFENILVPFRASRSLLVNLGYFGTRFPEFYQFLLRNSRTAQTPNGPKRFNIIQNILEYSEMFCRSSLFWNIKEHFCTSANTFRKSKSLNILKHSQTFANTYIQSKSFFGRRFSAASHVCQKKLWSSKSFRRFKNSCFSRTLLHLMAYFRKYLKVREYY